MLIVLARIDRHKERGGELGSYRTHQPTVQQCLQDKVLRSTANTKRGKKASPQQQQDILKVVQELEAATPTTNPALSDLISGRWSLLYTGLAAAGCLVQCPTSAANFDRKSKDKSKDLKVVSVSCLHCCIWWCATGTNHTGTDRVLLRPWSRK